MNADTWLLMAAEEEEDRRHERESPPPPPTCPWCGTHADPWATAEWHEKAASAWLMRNPLMCSECEGVGDLEDWGMA